MDQPPAVYVVRAARESDSASVARLHRHVMRTCLPYHPELQLWTFEQNEARAFHAKRGFREVGRTEGDNEERQPDVLLRWMRSWPA